MKTLILYSSHDGQTKKIADFLSRYIDGEVYVDALMENYTIESFDRVIDMGTLIKRFIALLKAIVINLNKKVRFFLGLI